MSSYIFSQLTVYISWETEEPGRKTTKPVFDRERNSHSEAIYPAFSTLHEHHKCGINNIMTRDEREYVWIREFLKVVTWMEKKFGAVEVNYEPRR